RGPGRDRSAPGEPGRAAGGRAGGRTGDARARRPRQELQRRPGRAEVPGGGRGRRPRRIPGGRDRGGRRRLALNEAGAELSTGSSTVGLVAEPYHELARLG